MLKGSLQFLLGLAVGAGLGVTAALALGARTDQASEGAQSDGGIGNSDPVLTALRRPLERYREAIGAARETLAGSRAELQKQYEASIARARDWS